MSDEGLRIAHARGMLTGMSTAEFWIYQDLPTHVARLHHRNCRHCNDGQGHSGTRNEAENWWLPFGSLEEARSAPIRASAVLSECGCIARSSAS